MIKKTVSAMGSGALVAAGFIAAGAVTVTDSAAENTSSATREEATTRLTLKQAVARAEAVTGARAIDVAVAGDHAQMFGIELVRSDTALVLVLVNATDGSVQRLDMGDGMV